MIEFLSIFMTLLVIVVGCFIALTLVATTLLLIYRFFDKYLGEDVAVGVGIFIALLFIILAISIGVYFGGEPI